MSWSYSLTEPISDLHQVRIHIGDTRYDDGPAPDRSNLDDDLIAHFLDVGGGVTGAVVLAFEHLAALWISRPIFGPGELSTSHVDMWKKFMAAADEWRGRDSDSGDITTSGPVVSIGSFTKVDGYTGNGSEYT